MHMVDSRSFCSENEEGAPPHVDQWTLTFGIPSIEEIATAIWQRQHSKLGLDAIHYDTKWREQSFPSIFWDNFVLDAHAVLTLLYKKCIEHHHRAGL
jgi:hypothetical protein